MRIAEQHNIATAMSALYTFVDQLSIQTGIRVIGYLSDVADLQGFNEVVESDEADAIDADAFAAGQIQPCGVVILRVSMDGRCEMFELSARLSQVSREFGLEPGAPASLLLQ